MESRNFNQKMIRYFGNEGLIMNIRSSRYLGAISPSLNELQTYYKNLKSTNVPSTIDIKNHMACCLYYLQKLEGKYINAFVREVIARIAKSDEINFQNLNLIFNIIDFEYKFSVSNKPQIKYLKDYLERFTVLSKGNTGNLLFLYYRTILFLRLGETDNAYRYSKQIESQLNQIKERNNDNLVKILVIKTYLLLAKICRPLNKLTEQEKYLKNVIEITKKENKFLSYKIGLELFYNYLLQEKHQSILVLLKGIESIVKDIPNRIEYELDLGAKMGFAGVVNFDLYYIKRAIGLLEAPLSKINNERIPNNKKIKLIKGYTFILNLLKMQCENKISGLVESANDFRKVFFPIVSDNNPDIVKNNIIINKDNASYFLLILNSILGNNDPEIKQYVKEFLNTVSLEIKNNTIISSRILAFTLGYNLILSPYTENYCKNKSDGQNIIREGMNFLNIITNVNRIDNEYRFEYFSKLLSEIFSAMIQVYIDNKEIANAEKVISEVDKILKSLGLNKYNSYGLICKGKGDLYLLKNELKNAEYFYHKATERLNQQPAKRGSCFFNLGYVHFKEGNFDQAKMYFQCCVDTFKRLNANKENYDFDASPSLIEKKINETENLIVFLKDNC